MTVIRFDAGRAIRGWREGEWPAYTVTETPFGGGSVDNVVTVKDSTYTERTTTGASNNCRLVPVLPFDVSSFSFTSHTPSIATVDGAGNVSCVSNGECHITLNTSRGMASFKRVMASSTSTVRVTSPSFVAGSLGKHVRDAIAAMVSGKTPSTTTQNVLSSTSGGWSAPNHIRNANLFTGAFDLNAISVYTEANDSNRFPMVLISQHHVIGGHAGTYPGKKVVFRHGSGYEVRTVLQQIAISKTVGEDYVGVLDAPITTITPIKFLPSNWRSYWPSYNSDRGSMQMLNKGWTAGDKIRILENYGGTWDEGRIDYINIRAASGEFSAWSSPPIGGDSNGPAFIPVSGSPVLLHCMNYASGGANYANYTTEIKAAMDAMSAAQSKPTQNLAFASMAGFTAYP